MKELKYYIVEMPDDNFETVMANNQAEAEEIAMNEYPDMLWIHAEDEE